MAVVIDSVFQNLDHGHNPVHLLMVGYTPNKADQFANILRNEGQAVRIYCAENKSQLTQVVETRPYDLVVINCDTKRLSKENSIGAIKEVNHSAAIILTTATPSSELRFAQQNNIRDVILKSDTEHLAFAIKREHQTLLLRQELTHIRRQANESAQRCENLLIESKAAIAYVHEGMHIQANQAYCDIFGIKDLNDIAGLPLMDLIVNEERISFKKALRNLSGEENINIDIKCLNSDNSSFDASIKLSPSHFEDEPCTQVMVTTQSQNLALQARIDELTNLDPHTQLHNRQAFMERLEELISEKTKKTLIGLVQITVNNFVELRDSIGIEQADKLLLSVANQLKAYANKSDTITRFGDHDFIILHTKKSPSLHKVGELCLTKLDAHNFKENDGISGQPIFSIGLTDFPNTENISSFELVNRSCKATKQASTDKENTIVTFDAAVSTDIIEQPSLNPSIVDQIDHALEHDDFRLMYQPIVSLQGDTRENYSVLLRLLDQNKEEFNSRKFWSHAERSNRLAEIDRWVVRHAIRELVKHRRDAKKINFFIMLSKHGIADESMLLWVCDCLREFKAKGAWLNFQFTESDLLNNVQPARRLIEGLKKINCRITLSHYSDSVEGKQLLSQLPLDAVRLSPSFVTKLGDETKQQDRLSSVNSELQSLGIKTIACSVENANSLAALWNIGVNYIQGFFLQEPSSKISFDE